MSSSRARVPYGSSFSIFSPRSLFSIRDVIRMRISIRLSMSNGFSKRAARAERLFEGAPKPSRAEQTVLPTLVVGGNKI